MTDNVTHLEAATPPPLPNAVAPQPSPQSNFYNDLIKSINDIIDNFQNQLQPIVHNAVKASAQAAINSYNGKSSIQGKLPWFKNGIKGFVNKLWHGDHEENPMWKAESYITLEAHMYLDGIINDNINELIKEESNMADLTPIVSILKNNIIQTIKKHIQLAQAAKKTSAIQSPNTLPTDVPVEKPVDPEVAASDAFFNKEKIDPAKKKEVRSWLNTDISKKAVGTIRKNQLHKAVKFMNDYGLDPESPQDAKLIWPKHKSGFSIHGLSDQHIDDSMPMIKSNFRQKGKKTVKKSTTKFTTAPLSTIGVSSNKEEENDDDVLEQYDNKKALEILESVSMSVKKDYYRNLLKYQI